MDISLEKEFPGQFFGVPCDVTKDEDLQAAFTLAKERHGFIDLVVNNAAIVHEGKWKEMIDINIKGVIACTKIALEFMSKKNGGRGGDIFQIGSVAFKTPHPMFPVYSATKSALSTYTHALVNGEKFVQVGVRVNCLHPGPVDTESTHFEPEQLREGHFAISAKLRATGNLATTKQVAEAVLKFLDEVGNQQGCDVIITGEGYRIDENPTKDVMKDFKYFTRRESLSPI